MTVVSPWFDEQARERGFGGMNLQNKSRTYKSHRPQKVTNPGVGVDIDAELEI
jgi:hypothetical protein